MFKKISALLLALLLAATALVACKEEAPPTTDPTAPGSGFEESGPQKTDGGEIGDSALTWEIYSDGTLYIKGSGEMGELARGEMDSVIQPWQKYKDNYGGLSITALVVENGVTSLAASAFAGCTKLQNVQIASSVSVLPEKCFKYCEALTRISAKGVVQIEDNALDSCVKLSTVTFSASLEMVGDGAFLRAGEESKSFSVRLAGTAEEWKLAKVKMDASDSDVFAIWTGNEKLLAGLQSVAFVEKDAA